MINRFSISSFFLFLAVCLPGCASTGSGSGDFSSDTACPPGWAVNPPQDEKYLYAVGWSGKTHRPSKSREQALIRAEIHIKNQMVLWQDMNRVIASDSLTESEVRGKIQGFTIVAERLCYGEDVPENLVGSTYILIRISKSRLKLR